MTGVNSLALRTIVLGGLCALCVACDKSVDGDNVGQFAKKSDLPEQATKDMPEYQRWDGKYPAGWPTWLTLPMNIYFSGAKSFADISADVGKGNPEAQSVCASILYGNVIVLGEVKARPKELIKWMVSQVPKGSVDDWKKQWEKDYLSYHFKLPDHMGYSVAVDRTNEASDDKQWCALRIYLIGYK